MDNNFTTTPKETNTEEVEEETLDSKLRRLVKDLCLNQPKDKDIIFYTIKWLLKEGGYTGTLLKSEEKSELEKLRKLIARYRKYDEHMKAAQQQPQNPQQPPQPVKKDPPELSDEDPDDIDPEMNVQQIKPIVDKIPFRYPFIEEKQGKEKEENKEKEDKKAEDKKQTKKQSKSQEDANFIRINIMQLPLFKTLESKILDKLIDHFTIKEFKAGENLINHDDELKYFYLIKTGKLDCYKKYPSTQEKLVMQFTPGDYYGELALVQKGKSTVRLAALEDGNCFILDGNTYYTIRRDYEAQKRKYNEKIIEKIPIFGTLLPKEKASLALHLKTAVYYEDEMIYNEGETSDVLYYIESGECHGTKSLEPGKPPESVNTYKQGTFLGERCMIAGEKKEEGLVAASPVVKVTALDRLAFEELFGPIEEILKRKEEIYNVYFPPPPPPEEEKKEEEKKEEEKKEEEKKEEEIIGKGGFRIERTVDVKFSKPASKKGSLKASPKKEEEKKETGSKKSSLKPSPKKEEEEKKVVETLGDGKTEDKHSHHEEVVEDVKKSPETGKEEDKKDTEMPVFNSRRRK